MKLKAKTPYRLNAIWDGAACQMSLFLQEVPDFPFYSKQSSPVLSFAVSDGRSAGLIARSLREIADAIDENLPKEARYSQDNVIDLADRLGEMFDKEPLR